tara:strand:- start:1016 stop:1474 length:459 start_codon:yes stop_codon:yes gene_type:complete
MDGINLVSIQDEILSHIETSFPQYEILEDELLDDESLLRVSNKTKPFIVIRWSGLSRDRAGASFSGVRHDEYFSRFDIVSIAPAPKIARKVLNLFMDKLIGWKISNGAALTPELGQEVFPSVDHNGVPHLYLGVGTLSFRFNSDNPDSNITP